MRILTREEFLSIHEGVLYSEYEPCFFGDLRIKGESLANDWFYQGIADAIDAENSDEAFQKLLLAQDGSETFSLDFDCQSRDGLFEDNQLYAVWEKEDVMAFVERLSQALVEYERAGT